MELKKSNLCPPAQISVTAKACVERTHDMVGQAHSLGDSDKSVNVLNFAIKVCETSCPQCLRCMHKLTELSYLASLENGWALVWPQDSCSASGFASPCST